MARVMSGSDRPGVSLLAACCYYYFIDVFKLLNCDEKTCVDVNGSGSTNGIVGVLC